VWPAHGLVLIVLPGIPDTDAEANKHGQGGEREHDSDRPLFSFCLLPRRLGPSFCLLGGSFTLSSGGVVPTASADLLGELAGRPFLRGTPTTR
jgi:hypothetical protein